MSRSWSNVAARLWPAPEGCIGLGFDGDRLVAARVKHAGETPCVTHIAEERLPFAPFRETLRSGDGAALAQALGRIGQSLNQSYWPLQIAVPDAAALFQVLEFDSLPASAQERNAIARFRLEKEWPAVARMECATQILDGEQGKVLMLAVGVERAWLDCIRSACRSAGMVPGVIDGAANHMFNRFHDHFVTEGHDGALISIEPSAWTILLWDGAQRPRFVRSRWRNATGGASGGEKQDAKLAPASDVALIASDVERVIRAYVLANPSRMIGSVNVSGSDADATQLIDTLNSRMRAPCIRLEPAEGITAAAGLEIHGLPSAVLAAAWPRV